MQDAYSDFTSLLPITYTSGIDKQIIGLLKECSQEISFACLAFYIVCQLSAAPVGYYSTFLSILHSPPFLLVPGVQLTRHIHQSPVLLAF